MQDVAAFITAKEIQLGGYLDPSRPALLDEEHSVRLNYETFFFADLANRRRFAAELTNYCGLLTDPVTKRRFRPSTVSRRMNFEGVLYLFENGHSAGAFREQPEDYVLPGWRM